MRSALWNLVLRIVASAGIALLLGFGFLCVLQGAFLLWPELESNLAPGFPDVAASTAARFMPMFLFGSMILIPSAAWMGGLICRDGPGLVKNAVRSAGSSAAVTTLVFAVSSWAFAHVFVPTSAEYYDDQGYRAWCRTFVLITGPASALLGVFASKFLVRASKGNPQSAI